MKNSKKKLLAAIAVFAGSSLVIFEAAHSYTKTNIGDATQTNYSLSFNKNSNRMFTGTSSSTGTTAGAYVAKTSLGNSISFEYNLSKKVTSKNWHVFASGSYFQNTTVLTNLANLTFTTAGSGTLTIEWSKYSDFSSSSSTTLYASASDIEVSTSFDSTYPSYFRISNATSAEILVRTLDINYLCGNGSDSSSSSSSEDSSSSETTSESSSESLPASESSSSSSTANPIEKTNLRYTVDDYIDNSVYAKSSCPTSGSPKLLIIPIWLTDSSSIITNSTYKANIKTDIEKAFLGTQDDTGWHSLSSYYYEESDGALNLTGVVTDWYSASYSISQVGSNMSYTTAIIESATDWYFNTYDTTANRSDFDYDGDGYLDGIMTIYAAPDFTQSNYSSYSNLWAYCYWLQGNADISNPQPNAFFWCSYDFFYGANTVYGRTGNVYFRGDTTNCTIDTHTVIHEFGHVLGLNDYYDYSGQYNPAGGFSMQDYNVGGHDPYSVMLSGWADPYIPNESCTIEIGAFQSTKDLILLTPSWNSSNSPFDEYLLLELYTPTGLNEFDSVNHYYYGYYPQGPSTAGIRVWHVDSRLINFASSTRIYTTLITNPAQSSYGVLQAMTNTYDSTTEDMSGYLSVWGDVFGNTYYDCNELQLIRNSTTATYRPTDDLNASSLFVDGDSFSMDDYSSQFVNGSSLNSGSSLGWNFSVSITGYGENAKASITCTKN